jgi:two-component system, NarL family, nitrate/nitrite response regulator NarL
VARNRILIADQSIAIRQTLIDLLQENSEIVATVEDGQSIFDVIAAVSPNLVLLGIDFQGTSGFEIARRLRQSQSPAKIIIISLHESRDLARAALAIGASGYVFMSRLLDDLPAAIDAASHGRVFEPKP